MAFPIQCSGWWSIHVLQSYHSCFLYPLPICDPVVVYADYVLSLLCMPICDPVVVYADYVLSLLCMLHNTDMEHYIMPLSSLILGFPLTLVTLCCKVVCILKTPLTFSDLTAQSIFQSIP